MYLVFIVLAVIAIPFIVAIFTSKEYSVVKTAVVNRPKEEVFDYIKMLKNGDNYNKWVMTDPGMKKEFTGIDGTVGFIYAWDSENKQAGKGEQEITGIVEGEKVTHEVRFIKPFEGKSNTFMTTVTLPGGETEITWGLSGGLNYIMRVMHMLLNLKKVLGKDMNESLIRLKDILEKNQ